MLDSGCRLLDATHRFQSMSYRNLEVWQMARELAVEIHEMSLTRLPKFELHETGSQIRRAAKSVRANIVEGYGRRMYKAEFVKHLVYALASCDETTDHLEELFATGSLTAEALFQRLRERLNLLGKKLNLFLQSVQAHHRSEK
jgi:four helix bundle protein